MENTQTTLILVEGTGDRDFFTSLFQSIAPDATTVRPNIHPDKDSKKQRISEQTSTSKNNKKNHHESKGALLNHIASDVNQLRDGLYKNMFYIIDADQTAHGQGYSRTYERFSRGFINEGYKPEPSSIEKNSLHVFIHDELPPIALWIMPDNHTDGVFEDWIKSCAIQENELTLAGTTIASLNPRKFKDHNAIKAEIYTWLAWQEKPALSLEYAWRNNLIDKTSPAFTNFEQQLKQFIQRLEDETTQA